MKYQHNLLEMVACRTHLFCDQDPHMNMVMTLLEMKPEAPSRSMCVPPRLRRVRPTWASASANVAPWTCFCFTGVVGLVTGVVLILERLPKALVKGVCGALGNEVPGVLALVLTKGVVLLLPDPWALGVLSTPTMLAMNKHLRSPKRPESHNCKMH